MLSRVWHGVIVIAVLFGLGLQLAITIRAPATPPGHAVGTLAGAGLPTRIVRVLSFFTVQSNILSAVTSAQLAGRGSWNGRSWPALRLAALVGITVTGVVYSTVLARVHEPKGWDQIVSNAIFHYLVPIMMVLGWLVFGPRPRIDGRAIALAAVWPLAWLGYTLAHGAASHWYPYPFLDVASHGYARVLGNVLSVLVVFGVVAALFRLGDRRLPPTGEASGPGAAGPQPPEAAARPGDQVDPTGRTERR